MQSGLRNFFSYKLILAFLCLVALIFMIWGALSDSGIVDELAHIPAGYGYVRYLDYRLNPEHPPLLKSLSALPLLFLRLNFPLNQTSWEKDVNGQWTAGSEFLYESGNNANAVIRTARIAPIALTLLLILLIFIWSRSFLGAWWALFPTALFALSPTVLAHGHYVTTDIAAAFGVVLATWFFLRYLSQFTQWAFLIAGIAFGIAQLAKFSAVLLIPYFLFLTLAWTILECLRKKTNLTQTFKKVCMSVLLCLALFAVGYLLVVYPVYALFTAHYPAERQISDTNFILASFAGGSAQNAYPCPVMRCLANVNIVLSRHALTRPIAQYMLGILMVIQRSSGGNTNYFLGHVSSIGSHLYFPVVYLFKEPLPNLIIVFFALGFFIYSFIKKIRWKETFVKTRILDHLAQNFREYALGCFVILYWAYSINSPLNIGFRHLMPALPFMYILSAVAWKQWTTNTSMPSAASLMHLAAAWIRIVLKKVLKYSFIFLLFVWLFAETTISAPYFLSYFNELAGGINNGYRYVTDSNYDWGQDFLRFKQWMDENSQVDRIAVDYFGAASPKYYLGDKDISWQSSYGDPRDAGIHWFAISINTLQSAIQPMSAGEHRKPEDEYRWLTALRPPAAGTGNTPEPDFRIGTSIFVYHL